MKYSGLMAMTAVFTETLNAKFVQKHVIHTQQSFLHETSGCHGSEGLHSDLLAWDIVLYHGGASTFRAEDRGTRFFPKCQQPSTRLLQCFQTRILQSKLLLLLISRISNVINTNVNKFVCHLIWHTNTILSQHFCKTETAALYTLLGSLIGTAGSM